MIRREVKISPAGFDLLQCSLLEYENRGYGPEASIVAACARVGLSPGEGIETILIVDPSLDGPIWPFMAWPKYWDPNDRTSWR